MADESEQIDAISASDEVSIFELGTSLLRHRRSIGLWIFAGVVLAVLSALTTKPSYTVTTSFVPKATDNMAARSGLASLAGQFGIQLGGGESQSNSPDFYAELLRSRVILGPLVSDTFSIAETGRKGVKLMDLLEVKDGPPELRLEYGVSKLRSLEGTNISPKTGIVQLSVVTPWPTLALAIANRQVAAVNEFNLRTRQGQASDERRFTENRLNEARATLRAAEDRLQSFLQNNRQFGTPELKFQQDRMEREVALDQQIVTSLAQAYEEVRIREVRNTPVFTVVEPPVLPTIPNARHRLLRLIFGVFFGGLIGMTIGFGRDLIGRHRHSGAPDAAAFFGTLSETRRGLTRWIPGMQKSDRA